jgi:hypothetical protein
VRLLGGGRRSEQREDQRGNCEGASEADTAFNPADLVPVAAAIQMFGCVGHRQPSTRILIEGGAAVCSLRHAGTVTAAT